MALVAIQPSVKKRDEESTLEKIALAFNIAQGALGTALAVPKFLQERQAVKQELQAKESEAKRQAEIFPSVKKKAELEAQKAEIDIGQYIDENSPTSEISKVGQLVAGMALPGQDLSKASFRQLKQVMPELIDLSKIKYDETTRQKRMDFDRETAKQDFEWKKELQALDAMYKKASTPASDKLPEEAKKQVSGLADTNSKRFMITSKIETVLDNWNKLTDDQKLQQGRQMVKSLNSDLGSDAVGAEEAKRLGSKLNFALGNFFNNNPTQFGRDLEGFYKDAWITVANLQNSMDLTENAITGQYESSGISRPTAPRVWATVKVTPEGILRKVSENKWMKVD